MNLYLAEDRRIFCKLLLLVWIFRREKRSGYSIRWNAHGIDDQQLISKLNLKTWFFYFETIDWGLWIKIFQKIIIWLVRNRPLGTIISILIQYFSKTEVIVIFVSISISLLTQQVCYQLTYDSTSKDFPIPDMGIRWTGSSRASFASRRCRRRRRGKGTWRDPRTGKCRNGVSPL